MDTEPGGETGRCYVAALSQHPDSAQAAAEVTAPVLAQLGPMPELAVFFVTPPHRDAVDDIADVVRSVLQPVTLLGAAAVAVLGPRREVEETPGVSLFAARLDSPAVPVRLEAERTGQGWQISGFPTDVAGTRSLLLIADPFTFPVDALLDELARMQPGLAVVGGMTSAANAPGDNRLLVDDSSLHRWGGRGASRRGRLPASRRVTGLPADRAPLHRHPRRRPHDPRARRPTGPRTATHHARAAATRRPSTRRTGPALRCRHRRNRRRVRARRLPHPRRARRRSCHRRRSGGRQPCGRFDRAVPGAGCGQRRRGLARLVDRARRPWRARVHLQRARRRLFGTPDHDATVVGDLLGTSALAGMFCAGELGPVGGRNAVHGFTASIAIFP